jgi:hypothetical protein
MIHQERELAIKRPPTGAMTRSTRSTANYLNLEAIKLQEVNRLIRAPASSPPKNPAVVFTATLEGDRLVLPWEAREQPATESPEFARHRQDGESQEFAKRDPRAAASAYRQAMAAARTPKETAKARTAAGPHARQGGRFRGRRRPIPRPPARRR